MAMIYDDEPVKMVFEKANLPEGDYIHVNLTGENKTPRSKRAGLDIALEHIASSSEKPLILYSFEGTYSLFQDKRFMKVMSKPNTHFLRLPFSPTEISGYLSLPTFYNRALEIAAESNEKIDLLSILRHNYRHHPEDNIQRAREELKLQVSDDEIASLLESPDARLPERSFGKLAGVFCDIEGTLLKGNEINYETMQKLLDYSRIYPLTLWTGGGLENISRLVGGKLRVFCERWMKETGKKTNLHLRTPILSKQLFRGSQPEIVIDDLDLEEFKAQYGIDPETYIPV